MLGNAKWCLLLTHLLSHFFFFGAFLDLLLELLDCDSPDCEERDAPSLSVIDLMLCSIRIY